MPAKKPFRFALLTFLDSLRQQVEEFMDPSEFTIDFFKIHYNSPVLGVQALFDKGYEVIIFYSSFGISILREIGQSVVLIRKSDTDFIKTLQKAGKIARKIGFPVHDEEHLDVAYFASLLNLDICKIPYSSVPVLRRRIREAIDAGVEALVGGGVCSEMAHEYSLPILTINPNREAIRYAIEQAKSVARARRKERESREQLLAVLRLFSEGVVCADDEGRIIFSNDKAFELLKEDPRHARGLAAHRKALFISDVLGDGLPREENIVSIKGEQLLVTTLPISIQPWSKGAVAFISDVNAIHDITGRIREMQRKTGFVAHFTIDDLKGRAPALDRVKDMARLYAPHSASIFIHGETGTGKEVLAQAIHNASPRRDHPFVAVNCAALPESLLESELFGYADGAFTGARRGGKAGVFEMAHKGTLFLDEIGDMGPGAQLRLLRVLETREIVRVGGDRVIPVDTRVICASHRALGAMVGQGLFRQDLFYRLAMLRLNIPPLRERLDDIPLLLEEPLRRYRRGRSEFAPAMLDMLRSYSWPGNVRELLSFVESYLIVSGGRRLEKALLGAMLREWTEAPSAAFAGRDSSAGPADRDSFAGRSQGEAAADSGPAPPSRPPEPAPQGDDLKSRLNAARRRIVMDAVRQCAGNKRLAAARLGISYNTMWRILGD